MNIEVINTRLDAVENLKNCEDIQRVFKDTTSKFPDLERLLAKLSSYSIKTASKAVYFEDVAAIKLKEFSRFLNIMIEVENMMDELETFDITSSLLLDLIKTTESGGKFPKLKPTCERLLSFIL